MPVKRPHSANCWTTADSRRTSRLSTPLPHVAYQPRTITGRPPWSTGRALEPQKLEVSAVAIPRLTSDINAIMFARMAQLLVRKLEPEVVARLKERAGRKGRSAEEEHRAILREALLGTEAESSKMSFEQYLRAMPDVGDDEDFARIEGGIREVDLSG